MRRIASRLRIDRQSFGAPRRLQAIMLGGLEMGKKTDRKFARNGAKGPRSSTWTYEDSIFWKELQDGPDPQRLFDGLRIATRDIAEGAHALAKCVAAALPRFTLHDRTHFENVLYWMEQFVTPEGIKELGPVGCAMCIVLAFTHDLGMVPTKGWGARVRDHASRDYTVFRRFASERHPALLDRLYTLERVGDREKNLRAEWILGFLEADFLRSTHGQGGRDGRVAAHLRNIAEQGALREPFDFLCAEPTAIALIADLCSSHNEAVDWLSRRLQSQNAGTGEYWRFYASAGTLNLVLPALLLRLADICDFDASRTPPVLFHQLGIEGFKELGIDVVDESSALTLGEWNKHLAIARWEWNPSSDNKLVYIAPRCPHPAVERAIRQFCQAIAPEIAGVRAELRRVFGEDGLRWLRLPDTVEPRVTPRGYVFHDIAFQLEAHQVTQLLMGTALYGNPELCIRELLQNALDAVQLRDLRIQLHQKLARAGRCGEMLAPVEEWTDEEQAEPKIGLDWGRDTDTGREWIRVRDWGTGMTLDQIER